MKEEIKTLLRGLLAEARGEDPSAHAQVAMRVATPEVLQGLDSEDDYANAARFRLRVSQVVEALARNPAPSARAAFLGLTDDPAFNEHEERTLALIRASVHIRPAPDALVAFWDRVSQPEDGFTPTTVTVLLDNGSVPAISLFATKLRDPAHPADEKLSWLRTRALCHRNDVALLEMSIRLLEGDLEEELRAPLVEVMFDFRPDAWGFRPTTTASAPPLEEASSEALEALVRLAIVALTMVRLDEHQRLVVNERRSLAEHLLRDRRDAAR